MKNIRISASIFAAACCLVFFCFPASMHAASDKNRPVVALVLEGGGALGFAHIGVIKVIEEIGIPVDIVVGTSMGATIGGFYALGYSAARMEEIVSGADWVGILSEQVSSSEESYRDRIDRSRYFVKLDFDRMGFRIPGSLLTGRKLLSFLDRLTIAESSPVDFDSFPRRFRAIATDFTTGERVVIGSGSLSDALRASMGVPGVFAPYFVEGRYLVDGGIVDNLPVGIAKSLGADLIIAVDLEGDKPFVPDNTNQNPLNDMSRSLEIMIRSNILREKPGADLVLSVDLSGYQTTDFQKMAELIVRGEESAREHRPEIEAFKAKLGVLSSHEADVRQTVQIPIQRVIVKGGNEADRARANTLFSPIVGTIPNDIYLEKVIATLESQGLYEYIRVQRTDDKSIPTLSVVLSRRGKPNHSLRLGVEYAATYSGSTENVFSLSPGVVFRGLTTEDSRLSANVRLLDSPAFETSFVQPIGTYLFVEGLFSVRQEADAYMGNPTINYLYQTGSMDIGINIGVKPARWFEISTGFSYEWIQADQNPDIRAGDEMDSAPMGHILLSMQRFDSPVFPVEGFSAKVRYVQSLSDTGTFRIFRTLLAEGLFIPALNCPFSFTVWGKAGSDFSKYADDPTAAPWYYKLNLANRQFFPGPLESRERIGSYIAGFGLEGKFQLNWATRVIGFPSFALLQVSVGTVLQDSADIDQVAAYTHWNSALGIGTRLNDAFGASVRVGVSRGFNYDFRPFIALDLGSIGY